MVGAGDATAAGEWTARGAPVTRIGVVGHHLSVGTGLPLTAAAAEAAALGAGWFEISAIPANEDVGGQAQVSVAGGPTAWRAAAATVQTAGLRLAALGAYNDFCLEGRAG